MVLVCFLFLLPGYSHAATIDPNYDSAAAAADAAEAQAVAANAIAQNPPSGTTQPQEEANLIAAATAQKAAADAFLSATNIAAQDAQTYATKGDATNANIFAQAAKKDSGVIGNIANTVDGYTKTSDLNSDSTNKQLTQLLAQIQTDQNLALTAAGKALTAVGDTSGAATSAAAADTAAKAAGASAGASSDFGATGGHCSLVNGDIAACLGDILGNVIKQIVVVFFLPLASVILGVCGLIFNWTIYATVFQFGNLVGNNTGMLAAWGVLRDIGNILLLFGFILMGVSTILDLPNSNFTAKRALPGLIIFAILLNFSLFAAEAVIDVTNALGSTFFNQAGSGICPPAESLISCATNYGIASSVFKESGISAIYDPTTVQQLPDGAEGAIAAIGITLFVLITAFVFIVAFFLLITRAVVLAFLMAISPIGFAGMAVPPLQGLAKQWWDQLLKQSFFAPLMILLMLIAIKFMHGVATALATTGSGDTNINLANAFRQSGASNMSIVIVFLLLIGFMLASVQIARSLGAIGAGAATKLAGGVTFGVYARATNLAVGGGAAGLARIQRRTNFGGPFAAAIQSGLMSAQKANLDIRQAAPGLAGAPVQHASYEDTKHQIEGVRQSMEKSKAEFEKAKDRDALIDDLKKREKDSTHKLSPKSEKFLAGLSAEQVAADHALQRSLMHAADLMSADQFKSLMDNKDISDAEKNVARDVRYARLGQQIGRSQGRDVRRWSVQDLEQFMRSNAYRDMEDTEKAEFMSLLSDDQYKGLTESRSILPAQRERLETLRKSRFDNAAVQKYEPSHPAADPDTGMAPDGTRIDRTLNHMNSSRRAQLDDDIIAGEDKTVGTAVRDRFSLSDFDAVRRGDKLTPEQRKSVGEHIDQVLTRTSGSTEMQDLFQTQAQTMSGNQWATLATFYGLKTAKPSSGGTSSGGATGGTGASRPPTTGPGRAPLTPGSRAPRR